MLWTSKNILTSKWSDAQRWINAEFWLDFHPWNYRMDSQNNIRKKQNNLILKLHFQYGNVFFTNIMGLGKGHSFKTLPLLVSIREKILGFFLCCFFVTSDIGQGSSGCSLHLKSSASLNETPESRDLFKGQESPWFFEERNERRKDPKLQNGYQTVVASKVLGNNVTPDPWGNDRQFDTHIISSQFGEKPPT